MTLDLKGLGFKQRARLKYLSNLEPDATKTIDFLLNPLLEQARQSDSKGGSPAEHLILKIYGFRGSRSCESRSRGFGFWGSGLGQIDIHDFSIMRDETAASWC